MSDHRGLFFFVNGHRDSYLRLRLISYRSFATSAIPAPTTPLGSLSDRLGMA
jgi:hypothetical protein